MSRLLAVQGAANPGVEEEVDRAAPETLWVLELSCGHGHRLHLVSASPGSAASGRSLPLSEPPVPCRA